MSVPLDDSTPCVLHEEIASINPLDVSDKDIIEYSRRLGIDLKQNPAFTSLVRDWILQPLPRNWFPCHDARTGHWFYWNALNDQSSWIHPLEEIHRSLVQEYCKPTGCSIFEIERGHPEGESAELSMEVDSKESISLSSPYIDSLPPTRNPRGLAPIQRTAKLEPLLLSKPYVNSVVPGILRNETGEVPVTTLTPGDPPVRSLLPSDQLFGNRSRPVNASALNRSVLPLTIIENKAGDGTKQADYRLSEKRDADTVLDRVSMNSVDVQREQGPSEIAKPPAGLSFTERIAAKRASRNKVNDADPSPIAKITDRVDPGDSKTKRVQFDLEPNQVRHYTPECSEEASKAIDRSESSSSEDFLDFASDPCLLKPLDECNSFPMVFEEKRWNVSFTSFGVASSPSGSPVKSPPTDPIVKEIGCNEMVTPFNSDYCPSPLPVKPSESENEPSADVQRPSLSTTDVATGSVRYLDIVSNIPLKLEASMQAFSEETSSSLVEPSAPVVELPVENTEISECETTRPVSLSELTPLRIPRPATNSKEVVAAKSTIATDFVGHAKTNSVQISASSTKVRPPKLTRSAPCGGSPEPIEPPSLAPTPPVAPCAPDMICARELNLLSVKTDGGPLWNIEPVPNAATNPCTFTALVQPSPSLDKETNTEATEGKSQTEFKPIGSSVTAGPNVPSIDNWLQMKSEMELALKEEKARLESWFAREINQIKKQFENKLANERQRTENLSKLVEEAKNEKEETVRKEIARLEETLARLVVEKSRETAQPSSVATFAHTAQQQDADVQTEFELPSHRPATGSPEMLTTASPDGLPETCSVLLRQVDCHSKSDDQQVPPLRVEPRFQCRCDSLQRQVARVEREMQLLRQKNLSFQKTQKPTTKTKKSAPIKANREHLESWWHDSDESTSSTASSVSERRFPARRSQSLSNLGGHGGTNGRRSTPIQRARILLNKNPPRKRAWMDDLSTDLSSDTPSVLSTTMSTGEWDTVLSSIQKISGDLREVCSHFVQRPRSLPYMSPTSPAAWMSIQQSYDGYSSRIPLHWSHHGSTAERTQALRSWLQRNSCSSQSFL